jgi:hypothetical protein
VFLSLKFETTKMRQVPCSSLSFQPDPKHVIRPAGQAQVEAEAKIDSGQQREQGKQRVECKRRCPREEEIIEERKEDD